MTSDPRGYTTTTSYNADDLSTLVTNPAGNQTLTCYDGDGNVIQTVPHRGGRQQPDTSVLCGSADDPARRGRHLLHL
jgi:YD repeat-containing protein